MQLVETAPPDLHAESLLELAGDFDELAFVAGAMAQRLHGWGEMRRWFERRRRELPDPQAQAAAGAAELLPHLTRMHQTYARLLRARLGVAAAMFAGVERARELALIGPGERVLCVLTGHGLKDIGSVELQPAS